MSIFIKTDIKVAKGVWVKRPRPATRISRFDETEYRNKGYEIIYRGIKRIGVRGFYKQMWAVRVG